MVQVVHQVQVELQVVVVHQELLAQRCISLRTFSVLPKPVSTIFFGSPGQSGFPELPDDFFARRGNVGSSQYPGFKIPSVIYGADLYSLIPV
jgi:hypothetical protein